MKKALIVATAFILLVGGFVVGQTTSWDIKSGYETKDDTLKVIEKTYDPPPVDPDPIVSEYNIKKE